MRILVVEPERVPYEMEIDGSLESMQKVVDGMIEAVYPYKEKVALVCNDEGLINGMKLNRAIPETESVIAGTFFVCGLGEERFESLDEKQMQIFKEKFAQKELFMQQDDGIAVMRLPSNHVDKLWVEVKEAQTIPKEQPDALAKGDKEPDKKPKQLKGR